MPTTNDIARECAEAVAKEVMDYVHQQHGCFPHYNQTQLPFRIISGLIEAKLSPRLDELEKDGKRIEKLIELIGKDGEYVLSVPTSQPETPRDSLWILFHVSEDKEISAKTLREVLDSVITAAMDKEGK